MGKYRVLGRNKVGAKLVKNVFPIVSLVFPIQKRLSPGSSKRLSRNNHHPLHFFLGKQIPISQTHSKIGNSSFMFDWQTQFLPGRNSAIGKKKKIGAGYGKLKTVWFKLTPRSHPYGS